jgi:hypothetical protein
MCLKMNLKKILRRSYKLNIVEVVSTFASEIKARLAKLFSPEEQPGAPSLISEKIPPE